MSDTTPSIPERVCSHLKHIAANGEITTYGAVNAALKIGNRELVDALNKICIDQAAANEPLLSVLVTNAKTHLPSAGFFTRVETLNLFRGGQDKEGYFRHELARVIERWGKAVVPDGLAYHWFEEYWPETDRDYSKLYMWFNDSIHSLNKRQRVRTGDRVAIYEVAKNPHTKAKGAKKLFALGIVEDEELSIPPEEQFRGNKRWLYKRALSTDLLVDPDDGVPVDEVRHALDVPVLTQRGFRIAKEKYARLEALLRRRILQISGKRTSALLGRAKLKSHPAVPLPPIKFGVPSGTDDPLEKLAKLEKATNAHRYLHGELSTVLARVGFVTEYNALVDLFAKAEGEDWIFEVKSAHDLNYRSQVRHAVAQLFEYRYRYGSDTTKICLFIECAPDELNRWILDYLEGLGIGIGWPVDGGLYFSVAGLAARINEFVK